MLSDHKILAIIALLFFSIHQSSSDPKVRQINNQWTVPHGFINVDMFKYLSPSVVDKFFYIICNNETTTKTENNINHNGTCYAIRESLSSNGSKDSCKFTLISKRNIELTHIPLYPINEDKIIIVTSKRNSEQKDYMYISLINMEDCTIRELIFFSFQEFIEAPIFFADSFKLMLSNITLCRGEDKCWLSYNYEGKIIDDPTNIPNFTNFIYPADFSSPKKGYYQVLMSLPPFGGPLKVYYNDFNGHSNTLMDTKKLKNSYFEHGMPVSNAHELFSFCHAFNHRSDNTSALVEKIRCIQTDTKMVKLNVTLELDAKYKNWMILLNLPGGGMVIATGPWDDANFPNFEIFKILADGKRSKSLKIDLNFQCYMKYTFYKLIEYNDNEFCFDIICTENLTYYRSCVRKDVI